MFETVKAEKIRSGNYSPWEISHGQRRNDPQVIREAVHQKSVEECARSYLADLTIKCRETTVTQYQYMMSKFIDWTREQGITQLQGITPAIVEKYAKSIKKDIRSATVILSVKLINRFLKSYGLSGFKIHKPKKPDKVEYVRKKDIIAMLDSLEESNDKWDLRDHLIITLLADLGLRAGELCNIKLNDIHDDCIKVKGKGGHERLVPMVKAVKMQVSDYIHGVRPLFFPRPEVENLIVGEGGKPFGRSGVYRTIQLVSKRAGVDRHIHPHQFRHSCATYMLNSGMKVEHVKEFLGHQNIATTAIYTEVFDSTIQRTIQLLNFEEKG